VLGQAALQTGLRQDAGEQAGLGVGQVVGGWLAVMHHRLADLIELCIGADAGELRRPVAPGHAAKGFVVVPEEGELAHAASCTHWGSMPCWWHQSWASCE